MPSMTCYIKMDFRRPIFYLNNVSGENMSKEISIVIPCYNEEGNIVPIIKSISGVFKDVSYELIFVDDGSCDNTWHMIEQQSKQTQIPIKAVRFSRNFGKEAAIYAGLEKSEGKYTALIDADLQQNPLVAFRMFKMLENDSNLDMVVAYQEKRIESKILGAFKRIFYKFINKLSEVNFARDASDFRVFNSKVRDAVLKMKEYHRFSKGLFSWVGFNTEFIAYEAEERKHGVTKWSFMKLMAYAVDGIVSFSVKPLKWSIFCGFICGLLAVIYMFIVFFQKIFWGINVSGYATIVILLLALGGMQMMFTGIMGEYLAKIFIQSKDRPIYLAKDYINNEEV